MTPRSRALRRKVVLVARRMAELGLVRGSSGNVSAREKDTLLITPSGVLYGYLHPFQVVAIDFAGRVVSGVGAPSSEWRMHVAIYQERQDVHAVVHTHSPYATVASFGEALSVVHDEGKMLFGEEVPVSQHAVPGTWGLAQAVVEALGEKGKAALIARHGAVAVGRSLREALLLAAKLEEVAQLALLRVRTGGDSVVPEDAPRE